MQNIERERKFILIEEKFFKEGFNKKEIEQGYLSIDPTGSHVRVRITNNRHAELTYKVDTSDKTTRKEFNMMIPMTTANMLMGTTKKVITKTRYSRKNSNHTIDVDFYPNGLKIVELEYTTDVLDEQHIPSFCGTEITGLTEYSNIQIAMNNANSNNANSNMNIKDT